MAKSDIKMPHVGGSRLLTMPTNKCGHGHKLTPILEIRYEGSYRRGEITHFHSLNILQHINFLLQKKY